MKIIPSVRLYKIKLEKFVNFGWKGKVIKTLKVASLIANKDVNLEFFLIVVQ